MGSSIDRYSIIRFLRDQKPFLQSEMGVRRIGLFGSYATDNARPDSDIDILVELEKPDFKLLMALQLYLEQHLGKTIDLVRVGPHLRPSFLNMIEKETIYA